MQDQDLLTLPRDFELPAERFLPAYEADEEPPLRYEVESMQHWLDLNA
jgi:hypothetical protein